jgi:hypothetical protein
MATSVTLYLPLSTTIVLQSFANAAWVQRVSMRPEAGISPVTFQGQGYYDTPIGQTTFTTPAHSQNPRGFAVTVSVDHSRDGGQSWEASVVNWAPCQVMYYNLSTVASEDATNNTWDDCTTYFSWSTAPNVFHETHTHQENHKHLEQQGRKERA